MSWGDWFGVGRQRCAPAGSLGDGVGNAAGFPSWVVEGEMRQCGQGHGWGQREKEVFFEFLTHR